MLSRFPVIPERYGQTDGRTDRIAISISCVSVLTRDSVLTRVKKESCRRVGLQMSNGDTFAVRRPQAYFVCITPFSFSIIINK